MNKSLRDLKPGNFFKIVPEDVERYGHPQSDIGRIFMLIEHEPGRTNCVDTNGAHGKFVDPDRFVKQMVVHYHFD